MKILARAALVAVLSLSMITAGCSVSQFDAVLNEIGPAISTILQIIAIAQGVPADTTVAGKVSADVATLENLYSDYQNVSATSQPGIESKINAAFSALQSDLGSIFTAAQVSDPNTEAKISALISLVQTGVNIAEAAIPHPASNLALKGSHLTADDLISSYNHVLVAKTGNAAVDAYTSKHTLHRHSKFVRVITAGVAK